MNFDQKTDNVPEKIITNESVQEKVPESIVSEEDKQAKAVEKAQKEKENNEQIVKVKEEIIKQLNKEKNKIESNEFGEANMFSNPDGVLRLIAEIEASGVDLDGNYKSPEAKAEFIKDFMREDKKDDGEYSVTGQLRMIQELIEKGKENRYRGGIIYGSGGVNRYFVDSGLQGGRKGDVSLRHNPGANLGVRESIRNRAVELGMKVIK